MKALAAAIHRSRLNRSTRRLHQLASAIEAGAYSTTDVSLLEVRRVAPAIVARRFEPPRAVALLTAAHKVPSNLALLAGLIASQTPDLALADRLSALAAAVGSIRARWLLPRRLIPILLTACEGVEWDAAAPDLVLPALSKAFRRRRSMSLWRRLLGELARQGLWNEISAQQRSRRLLAWRARRALAARPAADDRDAVQAAELIALTGCRTGDTGRTLARYWLLPLIGRSTERYLPRACCARRLSGQLAYPAHVDARELAGAIELGIAPREGDDYSNFREAFCPETWELLHPAFHDAGIFTELELFASADDRIRFWRQIVPKGGATR
jgi:hypothetical protein